MRTWAQLVKCCLKSCATIRDKGCLLIMRVQNFFVPIRLKTCGCILLVLAVFVLILMLYVTDILEIPKSSSVTPPAGVWDNFCKLKPLSPKEAFEEDLLLQSIAWPDTPPLKSLSLRKSSDPAHSNFTILGRMGGGQWQMGNKMEVIIKMYDFQGRPKNCGGDVIVARLHNPTLGAGVAGKVVDHLNGSYSVVFSLLWEGTAQVEVILVHPSEAVTVLGRLTREQPDRVFFESQFRSGRVSETTTCNVCLRPSRQPVCNYTELHTGQQWFCYKPKKLSCDARISHSKGGFTQNITVMEKKLFQSGVNLKVSIQASGHANITVLQQKKGQTSRQPEVSLESGPSGYYYQGVWRALDGTTVWQFNTSSAITQCLRGKVIKMYGDSTIRQLFEYFNGTLSGLKEFNLHSPKQTGPFIALDYPNNIFLTYRCHGPPIRFMNVPISELHYIANELDNVIGGSNTVVVLGIWSHFSTFPIEVYIRRLQSIRRAVVRLLSRAPETLVVIRTANPKALNLFETLTNSDWYSLQRDKVLRAMFKGLNVHLVDAWEMVVAYNLPHSLHPQPPIIKNMINVLLSYICPQKGG